MHIYIQAKHRSALRSMAVLSSNTSLETWCSN